MNPGAGEIVYRPVTISPGYSRGAMPKPERPSDLPSAAVNAGALLLEALWIQEQRAALNHERLDLVMREAKLAREQAKLVMDRADLAQERARHEAEKPSLTR